MRAEAAIEFIISPTRPRVGVSSHVTDVTTWLTSRVATTGVLLTWIVAEVKLGPRPCR